MHRMTQFQDAQDPYSDRDEDETQIRDGDETQIRDGDETQIRDCDETEYDATQIPGDNQDICTSPFVKEGVEEEDGLIEDDGRQDTQSPALLATREGKDFKVTDMVTTSDVCDLNTSQLETLMKGARMCVEQTIGKKKEGPSRLGY